MSNIAIVLADDIDAVIQKAAFSLHSATRPDTRIRLRSAQVKAMQLRYDRKDVPLCREIIAELTTEIPKRSYCAPDMVLAIDTLEMAYCIAAFWDLEMYFYALEFRRAPEKRFYEPRRKVLKPIVDEITKMIVDDAYDILVLNLPPRVGKSTTGIMTCSWVGGRECEKQSLLTGYASALTDSFYKELNTIMQDEEYNYGKIFRNIRRVGQSAEHTLIDYAPSDSKRTDLARYSTFACRAIGSSLNGQVEAAALLYCDDLTRGYEEALSIDQMDKLYGQYTSDLIGRAKEGFKQFHIGTRWSIHDPLGRVIESNKDNPRFKLIQIPALDPITDESNFDYDGGVGFSTEFYRERRRVLMDDVENNGPVTWLCLYQQDAIERGSIVFPENELRTTDNLDLVTRVQPDEMIAFCDVAFGGKDYLSMPIAAVYTRKNNEGETQNTVIIVDWLFVNKLGYTATEPMVCAKLRQWHVTRVVFEANNGGDFYSRDVEAMLAKDGGPRIFISHKLSTGNMTKLNRIEANVPAILQFVFLSKICYNDMYRNAVKNLTTFSRDGTNTNDDAPDSLAGLAAMLRTTCVSKAKVLSRKNL